MYRLLNAKLPILKDDWITNFVPQFFYLKGNIDDNGGLVG